MARFRLNNRYYHDLDTLVALISHLAVGKTSQRTPHGLSLDLSIEESVIVRVLDDYKSLFRKAARAAKRLPKAASRAANV